MRLTNERTVCIKGLSDGGDMGGFNHNVMFEEIYENGKVFVSLQSVMDNAA